MNRMLGLLAAFGITAVVFVGCGTPAAKGDDDKGGNQCVQPLSTCGSLCTNPLIDPANCGSCGHACGPTEQCSGGVCLCSGGLTKCGTGCTNVVSDPANCGTCGNACPATAQYCLGSQGCSANCPGMVCPSGACVNPLSDQTNCGTCGNVCGNGTMCNNGQCSCPSNMVPCGVSCVAPGTCNVGTGGTGGVGMGGTTSTGGVGGLATGGTGGVGTGGTTGGTGGSGPTGGTGGVVGGNPPGWWTHASWHGCPWTGIDIVAGTTTTNMPRDFMTHMPGTGYCVSGTVHGDYKSVALLGFNLNETPTANAMQCAYNPAAGMMMGPPGVMLGGTGIAINFTKVAAPRFRIQIQGPNGATLAAERWCANITAPTGPVFVPYTAFSTECWEGGVPVAFNPSSPISAISFLVPGEMGLASPFNYCINGFATGSSVADAPTWGTGGGGDQTGTIGGPGGDNLDYQRVKVGVGGKSYIIQNNNWGNPGGSDQLLTYRNNSFVVTSSTGSGSQAPASFPSVFIGANGDVQGGTFSTRSDDHLPKQISAITSVMSTFRHTGTSGNLNAVYDIWFSDQVPSTTLEYDDALDGFIMLWLYDPNGSGSPPQPIGSPGTAVTIGGQQWIPWVGPRGAGGNCQGTPCSANRPVVSYVATTTKTSFSGDLKPFFTDAASRGIPANWYLTDVFAGFECWTGNDCRSKEVQEFTATVLP